MLELSRAMGMVSQSGAASGVKALEAKGLLARHPKLARSMRLTAEGDAQLNSSDS